MTMKNKKNIYLDGSIYEEKQANMKSLTIDDTKIFYRKEYTDGGGEFTQIYRLDGQKPEKLWSWRNFKYVPTGNDIDNYVGTCYINYWIEDTSYRKSDVRRSLDYKMELINREDEINRGEVV